ncbi:MAG: pseudouridine synthase, partial [Planctomycetota bacterium]|nr:pseudouridine synthase [Planctomycetota bacterium]
MSKRPASNNQSSSNRSSNKQSGGDRSSRSRPVRKFGRPRRRVSNRPSDDPRPRLQKVLAAAGLGSRRESEQMILDGRVEVDRKVVTELGSRVDPTSQEVRVDGEVLKRPKLQHFMINKPMGVVSTASDPAGRLRVTDLVKSSQRLFTVGRLDMSSEGLILVTNDGELTNLLAHPRYGVEKVYLAQVVGTPTAEVLAKLERGIHLAEGYAHAKRVRIKGRYKQSTTLEIVLDEGRNREVRRLLARVGHKVLRLKRIALGRLRLGSLAPGEYRSLQKKEIDELKHGALEAIRLGTKQDPRPKRPKPVKEEVAIQPVESDAYPVDEIEIIAAAPSTSDQEYDWFINQPSPTVICGADDE